jgi:GT2 family glycosyltransferase/glycosyltransferase involved in cell wall biosynthesis
MTYPPQTPKADRLADQAGFLDCPRPIDIIIPCYRNAHLLEALFRSLHQCGPELARLRSRIIAVNDSPEDGELGGVIDRACADSEAVPIELIRNERNLGFVKSVNRALQLSIKEKRDVVLLNADTVVFEGALEEIARVACLDPMIGFVSPRSNNATICSLPHQPRSPQITPEEAYASFLELKWRLPRFRYVPVGVGFCLLIKSEILVEFGLLDEAYGHGYNEENDLMMRANRCGYRAALANHAFVYHTGGASFAVSDCSSAVQEQQNSAILSHRYPEYYPSVARYTASPEYQAERRLDALVPYSDGRLDLVFDFTRVGTYYCGTFEVAKRLLVHAIEAWRERFHVHVLVSEPAKAFHELDRLPGLHFVPPESNRTFAVAICPAQPFEHSALVRLSDLGVLNVYLMLDTIASDCLELNTPELDGLWRFVMRHADGVIYISDFVRRQFNSRFERRPGLKEVVAYPSMAFDDYSSPVAANLGGAYLLVIGNKFAHKRVPPTVKALSEALPFEKIVVIGMQGDFGQNVVSYASGYLSDTFIDGLYANAKVVIYPSLYEGFGIPVVKALTFQKPVLVRPLPVMWELKHRIPESENMIMYSSTEELIAILRNGVPAWTRERAAVAGGRNGWREAAVRVGTMLEEALAEEHRAELLARRLAALREGAYTSVDELVRKHERRIAEIYSSWSWRLTGPVRRLGSWYLQLRNRPNGSAGQP